MKLRVFALFLMGTSLLAGPAFAADPYEAQVEQFSWSGLYAGINAGYNWGEGDFTVQDSPLDSIVIDSDGWNAGAHAGARYQIGYIVLGGELNGGWIDSQGETTISLINWDVWTKEDWQLSAKAQAGVAFDRLLVYGTAGYAGSEFQVSAHDNCPGQCVGHGGSSRRWVNGWLIGAGVDYAISDPFTLGIEFNHIMQHDQAFEDKILGHTVKADGDLTRNMIQVKGSVKF